MHLPKRQAGDHRKNYWAHSRRFHPLPHTTPQFRALIGVVVFYWCSTNMTDASCGISPWWSFGPICDPSSPKSPANKIRIHLCCLFLFASLFSSSSLLSILALFSITEIWLVSKANASFPNCRTEVIFVLDVSGSVAPPDQQTMMRFTTQVRQHGFTLSSVYLLLLPLVHVPHPARVLSPPARTSPNS